MKKKVAAITTEYRRHSHADVIVGKILEGFNYDRGAGPELEVLSMYVDQFPERDMSRALAVNPTVKPSSRPLLAMSKSVVDSQAAIKPESP